MSTIPPPIVLSPLANAVETVLRVAGHDPLTWRYTVLVEGLESTGEPFMTALIGAERVADLVAVEATAADLIGMFADSSLAGAA